MVEGNNDNVVYSQVQKYYVGWKFRGAGRVPLTESCRVVPEFDLRFVLYTNTVTARLDLHNPTQTALYHTSGVELRMRATTSQHTSLHR